MIKVLIVDDDGLVRMSTAYLVEDLGCDYITADGAQRALQFLRHGERYDLIITDFAMPDMNGLELASIVNMLDPDMPIIVATGFAYLTKDYGARYTLLEKPFNSAQLRMAMMKAGIEPNGDA